jgi:hypothetical protein
MPLRKHIYDFLCSPLYFDATRLSCRYDKHTAHSVRTAHPRRRHRDDWDCDSRPELDSARALNRTTHDVPKVGVGVYGLQYGDGPNADSDLTARRGSWPVLY